MKAPCSFERFVRKLFINEEGLPLNHDYINKVNKSSYLNSIPIAHFTCTSAESFKSLYYEEIKNTDGYFIGIGNLSSNILKLYPDTILKLYPATLDANQTSDKIDFLQITANRDTWQSRNYYIQLYFLRNLAQDYMPKKKGIIILPKEKELLQGEDQSSRFDIMDWDD